MDKLKVFFATLKKHRFWVLTGLVVLLSVSIWYLATGTLEAVTAANTSKISGEFTETKNITAKHNHPNAKFKEGTEALERELRKDVDKAWTLVYVDQKSKVLKWPEELGEEFLDWMDDPEHHTAEIPEDLRDNYWNYVKEEFEGTLLKIVDARPYWDKDDEEAGIGMGRRRQMGAAGPGRARQKPKKDYKLVWNRKNQQAIDDQLEFPKGRPNSMQVRFCQENLWVYNALLNAVAYVNKEATGHHNAKIKEIIAIAIGQDASEMLTQSLAPGRILAADGTSGGPGVQGMGMPMAMTEGGAAQAPSPEAMEGGERAAMMGPGGPGMGGAKPPDDKRYVDEKGMPMLSGTPSQPEFKRMPILMQLFMDQREIDNLLVRLANSPLPVEIRQVRINTRMPGFSSPRPIIFGATQDAGGPGGRGAPGVIRRDREFQEAVQSPYDVAVELHGIIYIFNPPDKKLRETLVAEGVDAAVESAEAQAESGDARPAPVEEESAPKDEATTKPAAEPEAEGEADQATAADADAVAEEAEPKAKAKGDESTTEAPDQETAEPEPSAAEDKPAKKPAATKEDAPIDEGG